MPYATVSDAESQIGFSTDDTGNTRPTKTRLRKMLRRADNIINAEIHIEDNFLVERTKITCTAQTNIDDADYFTFYITDENGGEAAHYIWYDKSGSASDPAASGTNHEIDISSITTAREVASSTATVIDAIDSVTSWSHGSYLYIENDEMYNATDTTDEDTDFTIETEQDGQDDSGGMKNIAIELVGIIINNMFAYTNPDKFAFKNVELSKDHIRTIHKTYNRWASTSFELGE